MVSFWESLGEARGKLPEIRATTMAGLGDRPFPEIGLVLPPIKFQGGSCPRTFLENVTSLRTYLCSC